MAMHSEPSMPSSAIKSSIDDTGTIGAKKPRIQTFRPGTGSGALGSTDRSEMVYFDSAALGWSDNSPSAAFSVTDGSYHSYELSVDATGSATFSVDGSVKLTRSGYVSNGALAIGDQTNDAKVDGVLRIRSVTRECL